MNYWILAAALVALVLVFGLVGNRRRRGNGDGVPLQTDQRRLQGDENLLRQRSRPDSAGF